MSTIYWMAEPIDSMLQPDEGLDVSAYLSPEEMEQLLRLAVPKRRREWLAGRVALKRLYAFCECIPGGYGSFAIEREVTGAPYIARNGRRVEGSISISHSQGQVAVCYCLENLRIGIDVEEVTYREPAFFGDYFTVAEQSWVRAGEPAEQNVRLNLLWSAKESVLKSISSGLSVDPLKVVITLAEDSGIPDGWGTGSGISLQAEATFQWLIKWKDRGDSVLTFSVDASVNPELCQILIPQLD